MSLPLPGPREALIVLNMIPGLGPVRIRALLDHFGSPELVLHARSEFLQRIPGIGAKVAAALASWRECTAIEAELELAAQLGVHIVTVLDEDYPSILRGMYDPPTVLYARGNWREQDSERSVAIIGSRQTTPYGMTMARHFGRELAGHGCTIVSGLAHGIDTAGHWGALDAGGRTLAVLGSGLNRLFPEENRELAARIADSAGAVVSEFPLNFRPSKTSFPRRNRIVAGWSRASIVVEAPARSGALHTAHLALEMNKSVFAVPGRADSPHSRGCHDLIREGAILATSPNDVLEDMGWLHSAKPVQGTFNLAESGAGATSPGSSHAAAAPLADALPIDALDREILECVQQGHATLDLLCPAMGMSAAELTPRLTRLQIMRLLTALPGGRYALPRPPRG